MVDGFFHQKWFKIDRRTREKKMPFPQKNILICYKTYLYERFFFLFYAQFEKRENEKKRLRPKRVRRIQQKRIGKKEERGCERKRLERKTEKLKKTDRN